FPFAQDFHRSTEGAEAAIVDVIKGDFALAFKGGHEASDIDHFVFDLEEIVLETTLGQTALKGHLAAFKAGADTAASAGVLTLVTLAGRTSKAGTGTTAHALAGLAIFREGIEFVQIHALV